MDSYEYTRGSSFALVSAYRWKFCSLLPTWTTVTFHDEETSRPSLDDEEPPQEVPVVEKKHTTRHLSPICE